jgi:hypothetical protein
MTRVVMFCDVDGRSPIAAWLGELQHSDRAAYVKCRAAIALLKQFGHELRRPAADLLRDGIRELRVRKGHVNYRLLYFFSGKDIAVLAHGLTKEDVVPVADIDRAIRRKALFEANPTRHTLTFAE